MKRIAIIAVYLVSVLLGYLYLSACDNPPEVSGPGAQPLNKTITYLVQPILVTPGFDDNQSTLDDNTILTKAADTLNWCNIETNLKNSIPEGLIVSGQWLDESSSTALDLKRALQIEIGSVDLTAYGSLLAYVFRLRGGFFSEVATTLQGSACPDCPNWNDLVGYGSDSDIVSALEQYLDWYDGPFWYYAQDLKALYVKGSNDPDYNALPGQLKSGNIRGYGGNNSIDLIVKMHVMRDKPGGGNNNVTGKSYVIPGYTVAIPDSRIYLVDPFPGFSFHNHIFVNQRVLREEDPTMDSYCSISPDVALERAVGNLQGAVLHEFGHVLTPDLSDHCHNIDPIVSGNLNQSQYPGTCLMSPLLNGSKRDWVCSDTWFDIGANYNWAVGYDVPF